MNTMGRWVLGSLSFTVLPLAASLSQGCSSDPAPGQADSGDEVDPLKRRDSGSVDATNDVKKPDAALDAKVPDASIDAKLSDASLDVKLPDGAIDARPADAALPDGSVNPSVPTWSESSCKAWTESLVVASASSTLYFGGYAESASSTDPTGGYLLGSIPAQNGDFSSQMFASYVDCNGSNVDVQGFYAGKRDGTSLGSSGAPGSWFIDLAEDDFYGTFTGDLTDKVASGTYGVGGAASGSAPLSGMCNKPYDAPGYGTLCSNGSFYCTSPGTWQMSLVSDAAATFSATQCAPSSGSGISMQAAPSGGPPALYVVLSATKACAKKHPYVALCPNLKAAATKSACWTTAQSACTITSLGELTPAKLTACSDSCIYLSDQSTQSPFVAGDVYVALGVSSSSPLPKTPADLAAWITAYLKNPTASTGVTAYPRVVQLK